MILIKPEVYRLINAYVSYLIDNGITTQRRALEKKGLMIDSLSINLGGILTHRASPYKELGKDDGCLLYVYKDLKSKTQFGFGYKSFDENVIVYYMRNLKLA